MGRSSLLKRWYQMPLDGTRLVILIYLRLELSKEEKLALSVSLIYFFFNVQENSWKKKNFQKRRKTFKRIMLRHHHSFQFIWVSKRQFCLLALTATILYLRYALCSLGMPYCWEFDISNIFFVWPVWVCNWQDNWNNLEKSYGSIFLSIPTVLDPSLAPEGHHILHVFTTAGIEDWEVRTVF